MRRIEWSNSFKRDYRRIKGTPRYKDLDHLLRAVLVRLQSDQPLPQSYRDHALSGDGPVAVIAISGRTFC